MKNLRKEFPVFTHHTYLNTASSGLLYDSLLEFRQNHDFDFLIGGSLFRDSQQSFLHDVRTTISHSFGSTPENIVLTPNFSTGLNHILNGLKKTKKILLLEDDYPSINFAVESKGFDICYAKVDTYLEQNIEVAVKEYAPDVFVFSMVQYISGITIDHHFLKDLKSKYPNLLFIADATQFCGTITFDFNTSGIDILGCSGYKWLLGGYGNGFLLFGDNILDLITSKHHKTTAAHANYDSSYTNLRARFECGHLDTFNFGSLQHSIHFLSKIGFSAIEDQINILCNYAKEKLGSLDLLDKTIIERKTHSSIFNIKGNQALYTHLLQNNIITSLRGNGIRISLHFYNTTEDIDHLFDVLYRYR